MKHHLCEDGEGRRYEVTEIYEREIWVFKVSTARFGVVAQMNCARGREGTLEIGDVVVEDYARPLAARELAGWLGRREACFDLEMDPAVVLRLPDEELAGLRVEGDGPGA